MSIVSGQGKRGTGARPLQFGLRTLFLGVTAMCALLALMGAAGGFWSVMITWFLILVAIHVSANAWGTKAAGGDHPRVEDDDPPPRIPRGGMTASARSMPTAHLRERTPIGKPMLVITAIGALAGGTLGTAALAAEYWARSGLAAMSVGGLSSAVLGGFVGFLASSFVDAGARAWSEATSPPCGRDR